MKYSFKDTMRMFNCSRKEIIRALSKYGYFSKKSIIDDKCIDYLGKYFDKSSKGLADESLSLNANSNNAASLEEIMQMEFAKDCKFILKKLENTEENFYIDDLLAKAQIVNFLEDNTFDFLREYYPDLYRSAKDAASAYKTIGYIEHFSRYCLSDVGLFLELFVTYLLNRNGLVDICKSVYGSDSVNLFSRIRCLANNGLPRKIAELLDNTRLIRNKIHILLENNTHQYVPGSLNFSFQQDITEEDCRQCLENIYVLSCWLVRKDNSFESEKKN